MSNIKSTCIRFNLDKPLHQQAWGILQAEGKSYTQTVTAALLLYGERQKQLADDPYFENREREDRFVEQIVSAVEQALEKALPGFMAGCLLNMVQPYSIDKLPENVKLVLCGSYITVMKELLEEGNPLFGRFSLIQHIRDFDYLDAAKFYPDLSVRDKVAFYAVFGGSPYVLENLDTGLTIQENIERLLLPETGLVRSHIENVMLREIQKTFDARILEILGNGKKRYSEIRDKIANSETGLLDKQLKILLDMETIQKTDPINRRNDKKKQFYEIVDNLMRFYFTFIFGKAGTIARIGEEQFYNRNIDAVLEQFVSRRLEGIALQYFHRAAMLGKYPDIDDFGSYWYDDPVTKTNGEFDCVIRRGERYDFYECKYFDCPMTLEECRQEKEQLDSIKGITVSGAGFVCTGGFDFEGAEGFTLIDGKALYFNE